jgi:putative methionine-R-sulfoxide reductase with GAF domain
MDTALYRPKLKNAIGRVHERLEQARVRHNVDVFAFYIGNDPFMPSFLRCLAAPGAAFEEATSHFRLKPFPDDGTFCFVPDTRADSLGNRDGEAASRLIQRNRERNLVFGDFITRERIESRAWFVQRDAPHGQPEALLTVNYRSPRNEQEWHQHDKAPLQELFTSLRGHLEEIETLLKGMYTSLVWDLNRIINVALPTELGSRPGESSEQTLERMLTLAIGALWHILSDTPPEMWCGAIYMLDASRQRLQPKAQVGRFQLPRHDLDVTAGEGVVSWAAVREQAIRIRDLETSPRFKAIHRDFQPGIRCELAVPMIRGGQVIGVLSLESPEPDVFSLTGAGFLTRVASLAAVHLDLEQLREERDLYLEAIYASKRAETPVEPLPSFEELVRTSANLVKADF